MGAEIRTEVLVAGAGFVGLAVAAALGQAGLSVLLCDPALAAPPRPDLRVSAIAPGSRRLLEAIGAWASPDAAEAVRAMEISDARLADLLRPVYLGFEPAGVEGEPLAHIIANASLLGDLRAAADAAGVHTLAAPISAIRREGAHIMADLGGRHVRASLLVAADGARSPTRRLARIHAHGWRHDQTSIVTTVALEHPHDGRAVQHFLEGGPFALLPMTGRRASVVWSEPRLAAARLIALPDAAFLEALQARAGHVFGTLALAGPRAAHPLALVLAHRFVGERLALAGDAAHAIHPLAGQGVNLGFRDAAALVECVVDAARLGGDIGGEAVLQRYQRWRRFDTVAMVTATETLGRLFRIDAGPLRLARNVGMGLLDRAPALKRRLVEAAGGMAGTVPRLFQGERP